MSQLSPAALAIIEAYEGANMSAGLDGANPGGLAAALSAAVDWVIPMAKTPWGSTLTPVLTAAESRERFESIADELEAFESSGDSLEWLRNHFQTKIQS